MRNQSRPDARNLVSQQIHSFQAEVRILGKHFNEVLPREKCQFRILAHLSSQTVSSVRERSWQADNRSFSQLTLRINRSPSLQRQTYFPFENEKHAYARVATAEQNASLCLPRQ